MSSLDMVDYINATREPGKAVLRHDSFMAKVPSVVKECAKFLADYRHPQNGQTYKCYNLPEEAAMQMAMSYSYTLQLQVLRAWKAAEAAKAPAAVVAALPNFSDPYEAAITWAEQTTIAHDSHLKARHAANTPRLMPA